MTQTLIATSLNPVLRILRRASVALDGDEVLLLSIVWAVLANLLCGGSPPTRSQGHETVALDIRSTRPTQDLVAGFQGRMR